MNGKPIRKEKSYFAEIKLRYDSKDYFVFIEDQNGIQFYEKLFERLHEKDKIKVFPLGNKKAVLETFEEWYLTSKEFSRIVFIIDKDFDFLTSSRLISSDNLIELEKYTIENYLIQQESIVKYILIEGRYTDAEEIVQILKLLDWKSELQEALEDLFIDFAIAFKYTTMENCGLSPHRFLEKESYKVNQSAIQSYSEDLRNKCIEVGVDYHNQKNRIKNKFMVDGKLDYDSLIKGKYLLESLIKYIRQLFNLKHININSFYYIMADSVDINHFDFIKDRIQKIV